MTGGQRLSGYDVGVVPPPAEVLYGALAGTNSISDLYTLSPDDGAATSIGPTGYAITGLASRPSDGLLFGATSNQSGADPRSLVTINRTTGAATLVGSFGADPIADISFRSDGALYGYNASSHKLCSINTATGAITEIGAATPTPFQGGANAFDASDVLWLLSRGAHGAFYTVDESTGTLTTQPDTLSGSPAFSGSVSGASFGPLGVLWATITSGASAWIVTIDLTNGEITTIGATEDRMDAIAWGAS